MVETLRVGMYVAGAIAVLAIVLAGARNIRGGIGAVCLIVFFASISTQVEGKYFANVGQTWLNTLQAQRAPLYLAMSCVLGAIVAINARHVQATRISSVAVIMLVINLFAGILDTRTDPAGGAMRIGLATISIGALAMFVSAVLRTWDDYLPLMRGVGASGLVWVGATLVQVVLDKSQMLVNWNTRFVGLLGNPQGTAVYLGPMSAVTLWLMLNDSTRRTRIVWSCSYAVILMFVAWTGSRTGMLMTGLGAMFLLRAKFRSAVLLLPVLGIGLVGVAYLVDAMGIELPFKRFFEGGDTRSEAWLGLWHDAMDAGLFGEGIGGARFVENSYLYGWVVYGPIMLAVMIIQLVAMGITGAKAWSVRHEVPARARSLIDLILAYFSMYFIGAQFEWFIVARVDANISFIILFSCMASSMLAMVREQRAGHQDVAWRDDVVDTDEAERYGAGAEA